MIRLTRRYEFPAAHVLAHESFDSAENVRVYGKCANPNGHGHNYGVEVTVTGSLDPSSGRIIDPELLDALFDEHVRQPFGHRMLNDDPRFRERVPTAENIAIVLHETLRGPVEERSSARLVGIRVLETRRNFFEYGEPR